MTALIRKILVKQYFAENFPVNFDMTEGLSIITGGTVTAVQF
jgi:hypothetical protein